MGLAVFVLYETCGYCRDISIKIRSQLNVLRNNGAYIGAFAAFGYVKDPEDKHHLIIDEPAANIVEMVLERLREEKRLAEKVRERIAADQAEMEKCLDRLREKALRLFWETESIVRAGMTETLEDDGFGEIMKQEAMIRRAFSAKNPWVDKYCNLEVGESVTKELVGAAVEKVLIADFADVEILIH